MYRTITFIYILEFEKIDANVYNFFLVEQPKNLLRDSFNLTTAKLKLSF